MTFAKTFRRGDRVTFNGRFGTFRRPHYHNTAVVAWDDERMSAAVNYDALQHAPVVVIGPTVPTAPRMCPECGLPLSACEAVKVTPATNRQQRVRVVACGGCEFVQEVQK